MIRLGSLLVLMASIGFVSVTEALYAGDVKRDETVLAIYRSAGMKHPDRMKPMDSYEFTIAADGDWQFKPRKGHPGAGTLDAEDFDQWLEAIEDGLETVASDPTLGALDESFLDITLLTRDEKIQVRIFVLEELAQAIEKKIVELAKPER